MKYVLLIFLMCFACSDHAKGQSLTEPLQFNKNFYDLENHWVAFPKNEKTGKYPFGFIYIDAMAGFTFNLEGSFGIDAQGHVLRDSTDYLKTASYKYRLERNTKPVYAIPDEMLGALGVKKIPQWLSIYKVDMNATASKVNWGKHYNSAGAVQKALSFLEDAYKTDPHAPGLEFELTYSYNELKQYNKAIAILKEAIKNNPNDEMFYRELGYSFLHNKDQQSAIAAYLKGIEIAGQRNPEARAEMSWSLATIFREQKNDEAYKKWGKTAKELAPIGSGIGKLLSNVTF